MLDYEWGNPSTVMLSPDNDPGSDPTRHHHNTTTIFDHYASQASQASAFNNLVPPPPPPQQQSHHAAFAHHFNSAQAQQLHSIYDAHAYANASAYAPPNHHPLLSLDPIHGGAAHGLILVPKSEDLCRPVDFASRIGLNLGGRTYFSSEDDFMNRLYRRTRPATETGSNHAPRCQAEGCTADLSHAKHYHRRHKVCEFHSKASTVIANGLTQRFCQQCSRFKITPNAPLPNRVMTEMPSGLAFCSPPARPMIGKIPFAGHGGRSRKAFASV
ncbi:PREDICTED: squamosa [Prunus dulcis]|uniref:PREDICTED: squamosa n=1 Tax=Prunus dulcis TaxID=3755 RepID=A0A5E4FL67_PRUDU|nr:PREDICTED: squamosa [Prunus dulcis]